LPLALEKPGRWSSTDQLNIDVAAGGTGADGARRIFDHHVAAGRGCLHQTAHRAEPDIAAGRPRLDISGHGTHFHVAAGGEMESY
jgi:hypothetical protein